jgi:tetratricopeptide (TPR) repeat protein
MKCSIELLKSFANRAALAASGEEAARALRLLWLSGLFDQPAEPGHQKGEKKSSALNQPEPERVGIWERSGKGTDFTRRADLIQQWPFWANVRKIEPRRAQRRVVLIGESVARGYLLDPQFNPAIALASILRSQGPANAFEVVDLARTNLQFDEVAGLAASSLLLEPDAVIIYAGNNWGPSYSGTDPRCGGIVRDQGIPGLKRQSEILFAGEVRRMMAQVASVFKARNVPLIWMVPEFSLAAWRDQVTNAPCLGDGVNREWSACFDSARAALAARDYNLASQLAQKMVELDQETCVSGLYILAECHQAQGDLESARRCLESARDANIWRPGVQSPRPYSVSQRTLREEAPRLGNELVDTPALFKEYLGGELPGRRLFLDYCHLSAEGIQVVMAAAASSVLRALHIADVPWKALMQHCALPSSKVRAESEFLAAVHNAHWHQSYEVSRFYCRQALASAPEIAEVMSRFIELQIRRVPILMNKVAEEFVGVKWPCIQNYVLRLNSQILDRDLLDAIVAALREREIDIEPSFTRLRREEHSVASREANLLDYYYCSSADQFLEEQWVMPFAAPAPFHYYKAFSPESRFLFVGEAERPARLVLTARLPHASQTGELVVCMNGREEICIELGREWSAWDITFSPRAMQEGVNEVWLRWPQACFPGRQGVETLADDMMLGLEPDFYYIFGEIHSFTAAHAEPAGSTVAPAQDQQLAISK